ncbi:nucleoside hydrolase [Allokutzneria oryzae]|uniref:Nucleoside hydrolase n=1 Tax=Allokutzneria oryzae TaxID=1378989 RepID=A0ABV6A6R6_9PSEU
MTSAAARTPLVIDTDPGIDDAVALLLAANSPEVDLVAVTTVFGNVGPEVTTANALRVLRLIGREDVPVAAGADRPLVHALVHRAEGWHGQDGLGGQSGLLPEAVRSPEPIRAVEQLATVLRGAELPVTIAAIGPLTNIALLLGSYPELKPRIGRLVVMGGAFSGGNTTATSEFNIWSDPEAARRVLVEEDVPTTLVPLDLTLRCALDGPWLASLAAGGGAGETLAKVVEHYRNRYREFYGEDGVALHDALAVLEAARPGTLRTTPLPVDVLCDLGPARGATIADRRLNASGRRVDVALDADLDAVRALVLDRLRGGA